MDTQNLLLERIDHLENELQKATEDLQNQKIHNEEFILIASHDLQAPLRKLSTFVERLNNKTKDIPGEEITNYTDRILSTVKNMRSLIEGLAELSTVTTLENTFEKIDLNSLLNNIIQNALPEQKKNISFSDLPFIPGNYIQMKHLFENLFDNAIKFQKKDISLQLTIHAEQLKEEEKFNLDLLPNKKYTKIEISDNGIGFEQQYAEKIFQPFQRLFGKSEYAGNGLGLAICKKIAEKHNGKLYAKGIKNTGATFILILPEISN